MLPVPRVAQGARSGALPLRSSARARQPRKFSAPAPAGGASGTSVAAAPAPQARDVLRPGSRAPPGRSWPERAGGGAPGHSWPKSRPRRSRTILAGECGRARPGTFMEERAGRGGPPGRSWLRSEPGELRLLSLGSRGGARHVPRPAPCRGDDDRKARPPAPRRARDAGAASLGCPGDGRSDALWPVAGRARGRSWPKSRRGGPRTILAGERAGERARMLLLGSQGGARHRAAPGALRRRRRSQRSIAGAASRDARCRGGRPGRMPLGRPRPRAVGRPRLRAVGRSLGTPVGHPGGRFRRLIPRSRRSFALGAEDPPPDTRQTKIVRGGHPWRKVPPPDPTLTKFLRPRAPMAECSAADPSLTKFVRRRHPWRKVPSTWPPPDPRLTKIVRAA